MGSGGGAAEGAGGGVALGTGGGTSAAFTCGVGESNGEM